MSGAEIRIGERVIAQDALRHDAAKVAAALKAQGVQHGERVAIMMRNDPDFQLATTACGLLGAVPVPVNWHWRGAELRHVFTDSDARAAFVHSCFIAAVEEIVPEGVSIIEAPVRAEHAAAYGSCAPTGRHPMLDDWYSAHDPFDEPVSAAPLSLIYTSGTTGLPKGVIRSAMTPSSR